MGLWADGQTLWLSTLYQLWRFENLLRPGELQAVRHDLDHAVQRVTELTERLASIMNVRMG
jgi:hypothetical protein